MEHVARRTDINDNIVCHKVYIGKGVNGFVYLSRKGVYHIFISDTLSLEAQSEVLAHEIYHIKHDMPSGLYVIGLDAQLTEFEIKANAAGKKSAAAIFELLINAN